ncbi:glycosyltransferase [Neobacillus sp. FSL H8-0543]|uniref:glycosyltransferase n=1 Tax=Neobacillus sp. FSL H8-0543 TaxID=2954672 RepID=UPI0031583EE9
MVTIITPTNKPKEMENIFNNFLLQEWESKELIIILNRDDMEIEPWEIKAKEYANISVFQLPERITLGECLNFAVSKATFDIIAKFDDDDYYSPYYIAQAMQIFEEEQADIVGKSQLFTYFLNRKSLSIRNSINVIGGGTIMFRKRVFEKVQFPAKNLDEDSIFLKKAKRQGFKICRTNQYNYVYIRKDIRDHTWKVSEEHLERVSSEIMITDNYVPHVNQAP